MRSLLRPLVAFAVAATVPTFAFAADPPKPLKILVVTGGCCHDYTTQKDLIKKGLEDRAYMEVTTVQQGGTATSSKIELYEDPDWAKGYDLVIHDECFSDAKDVNWVHRVLLPHRQGLPGVVLHCAMHSYRLGNDDWFQFCGVTSHRHGAGYPHEVLNRAPEHPAMKGFGTGWANPAGELYWIEKVWPTATPLASAKNREKGNEEVCVWANEYGKTRVFGTTLGHHNETVGDPKFLDMLTCGVLWAVNKPADDYLKPRLPEYVPVDLALNKPATASSEESGKGNLAPKANDGNPGTRWCANGANLPQWWQVDLEKAHKVEGCKLTWEGGGPYKYKVEGSADAQTWHLLTDATKNDKGGPYTHLFSADGIRHVRVTCVGSNSGAWASLFDVQIFGDEKKLIDPAAAVDLKEKAVLDEVKIPEGFEKTLFATPPAVVYPVFVSSSVDGTVYVSVDKNGSLDRAAYRGAIYRLRDIDGDGRADESKLFVPDVDSPRGIVADGDTVYCLHPPHVSAFIDHNGDGISDEQKILVKNIAFTFKDRPADHTSNGVTLGIDGWLYFAIGDFGFMEAEGTDGKKLQLRAGGVVRCRPDGTGLELYTRGTRNILEVGLDPLLNGFARDNTNDGGGWDVRLHHFSGLEEHGYPSFYKNFQDDMVQPLADYGGGSGCGACYIDEPGFPKGYGNALYTADWGRSFIYKHNPTQAGATFTADQAEFVGATRVTDLDVDGDSNIYIASWKGATFTYAGEDVGYLVRVSPKGYKSPAMPDFAKASDAELVKLLESPSHRRRLEAQRRLIARNLDQDVTRSLVALATDAGRPLPARVAALYAVALKHQNAAVSPLLELVKDASIREYAIRALGDLGGKSPEAVAAVVSGVKDESPRIRRTAAWSLARIGSAKDGEALLPLLSDADAVVAHTAWKALVALHASDASLKIVDQPQSSPVARANAIRALESLHDPAVVQGLVSRLAKESDGGRKLDLFTALCRLNFKEGPWKGDSWGTRPDTSGPYYQPEKWESSETIASALKLSLDSAIGEQAAKMLAELQRHKVQLDGALDALIARAAKEPALVPGLIGQLSKSTTIPSAALDILRKTATDTSTSPELRASAIIALTKSGDEANVEPLLDALVKLQAANPSNELLASVREAFFSGAAILSAGEKLNAAAQKLDGKSSLWAEAALLSLSTAPAASVEGRELATKRLDEAWAAGQRKVQILQAVKLAQHRASADRVIAAVQDADGAVAAAANDTATSMKLDMKPKPKGPAIGTLKVEDVLAAVLKNKGDKGAGEALFVKLTCNKCHTTNAEQPQIGPFLGQVAATYKRRELAESVLVPSKSIAQGFATNVLELNDGRVLSLFIVKEGADEIIGRDTQGKEFKIPTADIDSRTTTTISLMPDGLLKDVTVDEFTSLVDYLESLAVKKKE